MSLVNDMLRDLDKRRQLPARSRRTGVVVDTAPEQRKSQKLLIVLLSVAVLGVGLGSGYFLFKRDLVDMGGQPPVLEPAAAVQERARPEAVADQAAPGTRLSIEEEALSDNGFSLRLSGDRQFSYTIDERDRNGITLKLSGVDSYNRVGRELDGISIIQSQESVVFELELERAADFQLGRDSSAAGYDVVLTAVYRDQGSEPALVSGTAGGGQAAGPENLTLNQQEQLAAGMPTPASETATPAGEPAATPQPGSGQQSEAASSAPVSEQGAARNTQTAPVRRNRGLTFEEQDRNTSQNAVALVQRGQLLEAYDRLLQFIDENPEAHRSREMLGTILLAQHEEAQAEAVIDEGLTLAPNFAPYKKIKARLLMQREEVAPALALMRRLPPPITTDTEYHELLATLYQQGGEHGLAVATYQELLRINSETSRWWVGLAISLDAQGDREKAVSGFQVALKQGDLPPSLRQYVQNRINVLSAGR